MKVRQMTTDRRRITLELDKRPEMVPVMESLYRKTGMRSGPDILAMALKQLDAFLPNPPGAKTQDGHGEVR